MAGKVKLLKTTMRALPLLLVLQTAWAQEVTEVDIRKAVGDDNPRLSLQLVLPMDISTLDFQNPLDPDKSMLTEVTDDTGHDMLAIDNQQRQEKLDRGYSFLQPAMTFGGMGKSSDGPGAALRIMLDAAPATGARVVTLAGTAMLNFIDTESSSSVTLEGLPLGAELGGEGTETSIGKVSIEPQMTMTMGEDQYRAFAVVSADAPILSATVVGEDATAEVREMGMGVGAAEIYFKGEPPATVDLEVEYASSTQREVPFKVEFGVGL